MRGAILVVMLALAVFVFGCTGQGTGSTNTSVQANNGAQAGQNSGTTQPMVNTSAPGSSSGGSTTGTTSGGTTTGGTTSGGTTVSGNASAGGSTDLSGKGYAALLAMGVPIQCQITVTSNGTTETVNTWMDGKGNVRIETPNTQSSSTGTCSGNMVIISSSTKMDMGCQSGQLFQGCDWFEVPLNQSTTSGGSMGGSTGGSPQSQAPDLTNVPSTQFNCQPWVLDTSKFSTSGKICSMQDIINSMGGGAGAGAGAGAGYGSYG